MNDKRNRRRLGIPLVSQEQAAHLQTLNPPAPSKAEMEATTIGPAKVQDSPDRFAPNEETARRDYSGEPNTCFILGSAACVFTDYENAVKDYGYQNVILVNDMGLEFAGAAVAWATLNGEQFPRYLKQREAKGYPAIPRLFTGLSAGDFDVVKRTATDIVEAKFLPEQQVGGSSGLFAVKVAIADLGYERAILCGIPMTIDQAHLTDPALWNDAPSFYAGWRQALPHIKGKVFSMSGWTKNLLGSPRDES